MGTLIIINPKALEEFNNQDNNLLNKFLNTTHYKYGNSVRHLWRPYLFGRHCRLCCGIVLLLSRWWRSRRMARTGSSGLVHGVCCRHTDDGYGWIEQKTFETG